MLASVKLLKSNIMYYNNLIKHHNTVFVNFVEKNIQRRCRIITLCVIRLTKKLTYAIVGNARNLKLI